MRIKVSHYRNLHHLVTFPFHDHMGMFHSHVLAKPCWSWENPQGNTRKIKTWHLRGKSLTSWDCCIWFWKGKITSPKRFSTDDVFHVIFVTLFHKHTHISLIRVEHFPCCVPRSCWKWNTDCQRNTLQLRSTHTSQPFTTAFLLAYLLTFSKITHQQVMIFLFSYSCPFLTKMKSSCYYFLFFCS